MSDRPSVTFDDLADRFQARVAEWVAKLRPLYENLTDTEIEHLAEQATYKEFRAV